MKQLEGQTALVDFESPDLLGFSPLPVPEVDLEVHVIVIDLGRFRPFLVSHLGREVNRGRRGITPNVFVSFRIGCAGSCETKQNRKVVCAIWREKMQEILRSNAVVRLRLSYG